MTNLCGTITQSSIICIGITGGQYYWVSHLESF